MTDLLKALLHNYGLLTITISQLSQRPGTAHATLSDYYKSLGQIQPDEPVLFVRISPDNEFRSLEEGQHDVTFEGESGEKTGVVTVWEMPEDEYYYFCAFHPGLFDLEKDLPPFIFEMALAYAYSLFESYLAEIIRMRLRRYPRLMGAKRQVNYEQVFESASIEALVDLLVDREIRDLTYQPLQILIAQMREDFGFTSLTHEYDSSLYYFSLVRNCVLHNGGKADAKLAKLKESIEIGQRIPIDEDAVSSAIISFRKFSYNVDQLFETLEGNIGDRT